jgi:AAA family ATPase
VSIQLSMLLRLLNWYASNALYSRNKANQTQTDGCSGAEIAALCQEAAMLTMKMDMNAGYVSVCSTCAQVFLSLTSSQVPQAAFLSAAKTSKRQITADVLLHFQQWATNNGAREI